MHRLTGHGGAVHDPAKTAAGPSGLEVVFEGVVLGRPVVPNRQGAGRPAKAAGELRFDRMIAEIRQQRAALGFGHALKASGKARIDEKTLPAGLGMGPHHGMDG